ncbi:MAG: cation diffusion facilitator family transporter [Nitrospirae bacterium]|jgi:cation diffusion facilitator family transporter|nr:cation diffusion facilitator family transporter [Nitrospirota bacterium]
MGYLDRTSEIRKVLLITLLLNILVSAAKIFYGYITGSISIFSDGFHSLFDGVSNIVGLIGIYIASHPPDEKHPYGHRKYETVFTIFVGLLMLFTCFEVFRKVYESLTGRHETTITTASFFVMVITLIINIFVSAYEKRKGEKLSSEFLIADSRHTKSDIYVSLGVIVSLVFIKLGFPIADPIAGAVVGIFIAKAGIDIIRESTETLVDRTQMDTSIIKEIACNVDGVMECHEIRTRGTRSHVFIDLHILVDPSLSVENAHRIAEAVEKEIKSKISEVVDVVVHIEPSS